MTMRETDRVPLDGAASTPPIRITREIPLWGLVSMLLALGGQAIALYYSQQEQARELARQGARQAEMAADLRSIATDIQKGSLDTAKLNFTVESMQQRLAILEAKTK
jgi:hypothetical protein